MGGGKSSDAQQTLELKRNVRNKKQQEMFLVSESSQVANNPKLKSDKKTEFSVLGCLLLFFCQMLNPPTKNGLKISRLRK